MAEDKNATSKKVSSYCMYPDTYIVLNCKHKGMKNLPKSNPKIESFTLFAYIWNVGGFKVHWVKFTDK